MRNANATARRDDLFSDTTDTNTCNQTDVFSDMPTRICDGDPPVESTERPIVRRRSSGSFTPGNVVLSRYEVKSLLGRGGMASVYLARHLATDRMVAVKIIESDAARDAQSVERFRREARALGRIRSDNVVAVLDFDAEIGRSPALVMEYLQGETVEQAMARGPLGFDLTRILAGQMLAGLVEAHAAGVIHRDLKPANVFIERRSSSGPRVKLLDFGLSTFADRPAVDLTREGLLVGTVGYMSPERLLGRVQSPDERVDLYAAGVVIFAMLAGRRPFQSNNEVTELSAVLWNEAPTLSAVLGRRVPESLEHFVAKAIAKEPDDRFQRADEMRKALFVALEGCVDAPARRAEVPVFDDATTNVRGVAVDPAPVAIAPRKSVAPTPAMNNTRPLRKVTPSVLPAATAKIASNRRVSTPPPPPARALTASMPAAQRRVSTPPPPPARALTASMPAQRRVSTPPSVPSAAMSRSTPAPQAATRSVTPAPAPLGAPAVTRPAPVALVAPVMPKVSAPAPTVARPSLPSVVITFDEDVRSARRRMMRIAAAAISGALAGALALTLALRPSTPPVERPAAAPVEITAPAPIVARPASVAQPAAPAAIAAPVRAPVVAPAAPASPTDDGHHHRHHRADRLVEAVPF